MKFDIQKIKRRTRQVLSLLGILIVCLFSGFPFIRTFQSGLPPGGTEKSGLPPGATIWGPGTAQAQVDLYQYNMGEILNAWNQRVDTLLFNDTLVGGDTVESAPIGIVGIYSGKPQYWVAAIAVDTLTGYPSPGFKAEFRVKFRGKWAKNADGAEKFIENGLALPAYPWVLVWPLTVYAGDSMKFIYTATGTCLVWHCHWQVH